MVPGGSHVPDDNRDESDGRDEILERQLAKDELADQQQLAAARVGFDWPDASGPRAKIDEELVTQVAEGLGLSILIKGPIGLLVIANESAIHHEFHDRSSV